MSKTRADMNRRQFIKLVSGTASGASLGMLSGCGFSPFVRNIPVGVQLYSVRHELAEDFRGTIAQLAEMGYEGVEFADYFDFPASELRAILDEHGLHCCGSHVYLRELQGDAFEESIAYSQTLGNENFIIRWIPNDRRDSHDAFLRYIEEINEVVERLEPLGMRLGYHNHDYIFERFGGMTMWDILAERTDERFKFQVDTGHAAGYGLDPVELLKSVPGRTPSIHAKAYSAVNSAAVIGEDDLDWPEIIRTTLDVSGIEWFILEYEIEGVPPLEALKATIDNFRTIKAGL